MDFEKVTREELKLIHVPGKKTKLTTLFNHRKMVNLFQGKTRYLTIILVLLLTSICSFCQTKQQLDSLTNLLESIEADDQKYRTGFDSVIQKYGMNSPEFIELVKKMNFQDSVNMLLVGQILDTYGWLSKEQTSQDANKALFLVIQHATLQSQLKYLPLMKQAVADKNAKGSDYALLVDRTNMYQSKLQIYGSQLNYDAKGNFHIYPISDEPNVDNRRKSVGLPPMQEYLNYFPQKILYTLPKTDRYKNKIIIKGSAYDDKKNLPLSNVFIYSAKELLLGKSDTSGFFQVVVDKKYRNQKIIFRKQNFLPFEFKLLNGAEKDVIEINPTLKQE